MEESSKKGFSSGLIAFSLWGILPLYWRLFQNISLRYILSHRIIWSFVILLLTLIISKKQELLLKTIKNRKCMCNIILSSLILCMNWSIYIWAINSGYVIEASLGYYINPIILVILGILFLKEQLTKIVKLALSFALASVLLLTLQYGRMPLVALALAFTFALYGFSKKLSKTDPQVGLTLEIMFLIPMSMILLLKDLKNSEGLFYDFNLGTLIGLITTGLVTVIPLIFYSKATKTIKLSTIGMLQYISPTIMLIIGVFVFKEEFTSIHLLSFFLICISLCIFSYSQFKSPLDGSADCL